jgi:hypothetical protein
MDLHPVTSELCRDRGTELISADRRVEIAAASHPGHLDCRHGSAAGCAAPALAPVDDVTRFGDRFHPHELSRFDVTYDGYAGRANSRSSPV